MEAILNRSPVPPTRVNPELPGEFEITLAKALEKDREMRCQTAAELRTDLKRLKRETESSRSAIGSGFSGALRPVSQSAAATKRRLVTVAIAAAATTLVAGLAAGILVGRRQSQAAQPVYHQLTYRRGTVYSARFAPDGQTIIYSAAWDGKRPEIYSTRGDSPESRPLNFPGAQIAGISSSGEMAVLLQSRSGIFQQFGTLARVPLAGGAPREVMNLVNWADWLPDSSNLAIVHIQDGFGEIEFPIGKTIYKTAGWVGDARVSPKGDQVAFIDHTLLGDDGGSISVVDSASNRKTLSSKWVSAQGLAWSPNGEEVWFTATRLGVGRSIYAVSLSGKERLIVRIPATLTLFDIARDGRVLLKRESVRYEIKGHIAGETAERELSWFDSSLPAGLSADGKTLVFTEVGEAGGATYGVYIRDTDGGQAVRLGDGNAAALSRDGKWVLCETHSFPQQLFLLPTKAGEPKRLTNDSIDHLGAAWHPDGKRIIFSGASPGHGNRNYIMDLNGGEPKAITPEGGGTLGIVISPDGKLVNGGGPGEKQYFYPIEGGDPILVPGLQPNEYVLTWAVDGRSFLVQNFAGLPGVITRVDFPSGKRTTWKQTVPADAAGVDTMDTIYFAPDLKSYVYSYSRVLSDLYVVEGLK